MKHYMGKLLVSSTALICDEDARVIASAVPMMQEIPELAVPIIEVEGNVRRLVACWNALQGVPLDHVEKATITVPEIPYQDMLAQRDELLRCLKQHEAAADSRQAFEDLECFIDDPATHMEHWDEYRQRRDARIAISNAELHGAAKPAVNNGPFLVTPRNEEILRREFGWKKPDEQAG